MPPLRVPPDGADQGVRDRLRASEKPEFVIFDAVRQVVTESGVLATLVWRRPQDSTMLHELRSLPKTP